MVANRQAGRTCAQSMVPVTLKESEKENVKSLSRVRLFATPWTVAYQAPSSIETFH